MCIMLSIQLRVIWADWCQSREEAQGIQNPDPPNSQHRRVDNGALFESLMYHRNMEIYSLEPTSQFDLRMLR
jgi:hypothetical protein